MITPYWYQRMLMECPSPRRLMIAPRKMGKTTALLMDLQAQVSPKSGLVEPEPKTILCLGSSLAAKEHLIHTFSKLMDPDASGPIGGDRYVYSAAGDKVIFSSADSKNWLGRPFNMLYLDEVDHMKVGEVDDALAYFHSYPVVAATTPRRINPAKLDTPLSHLLTRGEFMTFHVPITAHPDIYREFFFAREGMSPEAIQAELLAVYL